MNWSNCHYQPNIRLMLADKDYDSDGMLLKDILPFNHKLLIIDELGFVPLSKTGAELLFEPISKRC